MLLNVNISVALKERRTLMMDEKGKVKRSTKKEGAQPRQKTPATPKLYFHHDPDHFEDLSFFSRISIKMSQHNHQPQYVHYTGPPGIQSQIIAPPETTTHQHAPPLVATGDWTKSLVELAKTAELKCVVISVMLRLGRS